ncbi:MAG: LamG-like jellyroll fold domain-containing protein [Acidimicrobiia bacterium]
MDLPAGVLDGGDEVSVALWFQTTKTGQQALISGANASNSNEFLVFLASDTNVWFYTGARRNSRVTWKVASVAYGLWHHLAVVRDGSNSQVTLYIDGASQGTKSATLNPLQIDAGGLVLGQEQDSVGGGYTASQAFAGTLHEVRLYNQALTATEITTLATPPIS